MPEADLVIKFTDCVLHCRESLDGDTLVPGCLQVKYIIGLLTKFENHCRVIELAASVSSDQFASRSIASEKKNVESVGLGDELLL